LPKGLAPQRSETTDTGRAPYECELQQHNAGGGSRRPFLKSAQSGFKSQWGHSVSAARSGFGDARLRAGLGVTSCHNSTETSAAARSASSWLCAYTDSVNAALAASKRA